MRAHWTLPQDAFKVLQPPSEEPKPLDEEAPDDSATISRMRETLGDFFTESLMGDGGRARALLSGSG